VRPGLSRPVSAKTAHNEKLSIDFWAKESIIIIVREVNENELNDY